MLGWVEGGAASSVVFMVVVTWVYLTPPPASPAPRVAGGPPRSYEAARRQLRRDIRELRLVTQAKAEGEVLEEVSRYVEGMEGGLGELGRTDGWGEWRRRESRRAAAIAQARIVRYINR